jgi:hypothetical protein
MTHLPAGYDRFPSFAEWQSLLQERLAVTCLVGFEGSDGGEVLGGSARPWGHCWVNGSVRTTLDATDGFTTWTEVLPAQLGPRGVVLLFRLAFGNGASLPQQSGAFRLDVNGRPALRVTTVRGRQCWHGDEVKLLFVPEVSRASRMGEALVLDPQLSQETWAIEGTALLWLGPGRVETNRPVNLHVAADPVLPSRNWLRVSSPVTDQHAFVHEQQVEELLARVQSRVRDGGQRLLFGDLHNHTGETEGGLPCGRGTRQEALTYARDVAGLDFCCLSEHDFQLGADEWQLLQESNDAADDPGRFGVIHGYEWTSASYGHRNVYFRDRGGPFVRASDRSPDGGDWSWDATGPNAPLQRGDHEYHPRRLWQALESWGGDAITIPHHPAAAVWPLSLRQAFSAKYDRLVEIYSGWGDSLHTSSPFNSNVQYVPDLEISRVVSEFPIGFVASSDSHDGHPGNAQGHEEHAHFFHAAGSGQVAVYAQELSREDIFDALWNRRCYAITGGRTELEVNLNGAPMGSEIPIATLSERPTLEVALRDDLPCERLDVFSSGGIVHSEYVDARSAQIAWVDHSWEKGDAGTYYVRATREDGERCWSSPIRLVA